MAVAAVAAEIHEGPGAGLARAVFEFGKAVAGEHLRAERAGRILAALVDDGLDFLRERVGVGVGDLAAEAGGFVVVCPECGAREPFVAAIAVRFGDGVGFGPDQPRDVAGSAGVADVGRAMSSITRFHAAV